MVLNKHSIVAKIQSELRLPRRQATQTLESLIEIIKSTLESGEDFLFSGFGRFCVKDKQQRKGRNPATGQAMILRSRKVVKFKCSGKLRNIINS
jgi:integration host factor subunit alpha